MSTGATDTTDTEITSTHPIVVIVHGGQWGDEGKGKLTDYIIDLLAKLGLKNKLDTICIRFNGGSNAGHTVKINGVYFYTHVLPSGLLTPGVINVMGNGMVISLGSMFDELADMKSKGVEYDGRLLISNRAQVVFDFHKLYDSLSGGKIGTTCQGIGPTYSDRAKRTGFRMSQLLRPDWKEEVKSQYARYCVKIANAYPEYFIKNGTTSFEEMRDKEIKLIEDNYEFLKKSICDTTSLINRRYHECNVVFEGANASMLDIQFGTYPYVTSSDCTVQGAFTGTGLNPAKFYNSDYEIIGIVKAYTTRVGNGVLPTQYDDEKNKLIATVGGEKGVTTGRLRRCGALDLVQVKYVTTINGYTHLDLTKLDVLSELDEITVCIGYEDQTGTAVREYPCDEYELAKVVPVMKTFPGWKGFDISSVKTYDDLHENIHEYIEYIEHYLGVPVKYINTGPGRDQIIVRDC